MLLQLQPAPEARSADRQVPFQWSVVARLVGFYVSLGSLAAGQLLALLTLLAVYRVIRSSCQTHAGYGESSLANRGGCGGVAVQTSYRPQERRQGKTWPAHLSTQYPQGCWAKYQAMPPPYSYWYYWYARYPKPWTNCCDRKNRNTYVVMFDCNSHEGISPPPTGSSLHF